MEELLRQTPETAEKYQRESWIPFKVEEELLRRAKLLQLADKDQELQAGLMSMCKLDIVFWLNNFGWIYEPRAGREHTMPWILYPHEIKNIDWLEERFARQEDGLTEKSRDMGATWTAIGWIIHHWLFDDEFSALIGSRKEDLVDNKLPDSIFGKADFLLDHLPWWMMPHGWDKNKHRNYMKIIHPRKLNSITGESTNPAFSRSGRYSVIFVDEFAFVERSYSIWQAMGDATSVRLPVSTPNGKGNKFAELALESPIQKLTLHWKQHPDKDEAWYAKEQTRRTEEEIAQELDISYERSQKGRVFKTEWDELVRGKRLTEVAYDPMLPVDTSWDFGLDTTAIGFYQQQKDGTVKMIDYYENAGYSIDHYLKILEQKAEKYRFYHHYGDITISRKEFGTGKSVWEILKNYRSPNFQSGIRIRGKVTKNLTSLINAGKMMVRQMYVAKHLNEFVDAVENYHYPWDEEKQQFGEDPVHDWSSHGCMQLCYYAVNRTSYQEEVRKPQNLDTERLKHATTTY